MDLTVQDINTLLEALPAWLNYADLSDGMVDVALAMMGPRDPGEREQWKAKQESEREQRKAAKADEKRLKTERSIILQAKFIQLRDRLEAEAFASSR